MGKIVWLVNLAFLAGSLWFGYANYRFWNEEKPAPPAAVDESPPKVETISIPVPAPPPPREEYKTIEDGNLFVQGRVPQAPLPPPQAVEAVKPQPVENPQDRYALYGVIRVGQEKYFALIKDKKTPNSKTQGYGIGDNLSGNLVIKKIEEKRVLVTTLTGESELRLRGTKGSEDTGYVPKPITPTMPTAPAMQPEMQRPPGMIQQPPQPQVQVPRPGVVPQHPGVQQRRPAPPPVEEDEEYYDDEEDTNDMTDEEDYYGDEE